MSQLLRIGLLAIGLIGFVATSHAQRLYKHVDADGNVFFTDVPQPKDKDLPRDTLNDQGIVVERVERAKTEAELRAAMLEAQAIAKRQAEAEQRRREDVQLLLTYASEDDIVGTRDQRIQVVDRAAEASRAYISGRTRGLSNLMERAAQLESRGHAVSDALRSSIDEIRRQINEQEEFIKLKDVERQELYEYYEAELARYREVKQRGTTVRESAGL